MHSRRYPYPIQYEPILCRRAFGRVAVRVACKMTLFLRRFAVKLLRPRASGSRSLSATRVRTLADHARSGDPSVVLDEQQVRHPSAVLRVRLPCSLAVSPVNVGDDPDTVTVTFLGRRPQLFLDGESPISLSVDRSGIAHLTMTGAEGGQSTTPRPDVMCRLRVPFMASIDVELSGGVQAKLENLVLDLCSVQTEGPGSIILTHVKANAMKLSSEHGNIKATGALHSNLEVIARGTGSFEAQRLLANNLKVETSTGSQHVSAAYADRADLVSREGNIDLGSLHSSEATLASESGNITLRGLDGDRCSVTTGCGDISVVVARSQDLSVTTESGNCVCCLLAEKNLKGTMQ
ncbi:hypothetical protein V5799_000710 [Amblyomma americanum]|uniref:DUF4097 domain-containing protein n=1 Tax=Amblyomma americanum TaxID=6943 RepID=A0AAQ4D298_AMBAM